MKETGHLRDVTFHYDDLLFVGLNGTVTALSRVDGAEVWSWKAPRGAGFVSLLPQADMCVVGVGGYVYCIDPLTGQSLWENAMKGKGIGVVSLAAGELTSDSSGAAKLAQDARANLSVATHPGD
jgi:outer membrane protein assembly factor BamB